MKKLDVKCYLIILTIIFMNIIFFSEAYSQENQVLRVELPAIIAVAYTPKTSVDANEELSTVFDDFSFHLSSAERQLAPLGVNFYSVEKQKVFFKFLNKTDSIDIAKEDAIVGYVFISSKGKVLKRFHVLTDVELVEIAQKQFDLKKSKQK